MIAGGFRVIIPYLCIVLVFYALQPETFALGQFSHAAFTVFIVKYFHFLITPPHVTTVGEIASAE